MPKMVAAVFGATGRSEPPAVSSTSLPATPARATPSTGRLPPRTMSPSECRLTLPPARTTSSWMPRLSALRNEKSPRAPPDSRPTPVGASHADAAGLRLRMQAGNADHGVRSLHDVAAPAIRRRAPFVAPCAPPVVVAVIWPRRSMPWSADRVSWLPDFQATAASPASLMCPSPCSPGGTRRHGHVRLFQLLVQRLGRENRLAFRKRVGRVPPAGW
jgi:hypothetical protein